MFLNHTERGERECHFHATNIQHLRPLEEKIEKGNLTFFYQYSTANAVGRMELFHLNNLKALSFGEGLGEVERFLVITPALLRRA